MVKGLLGEKSLTIFVSAICVVMLVLIGVRLYSMLKPAPTEAVTQPFACDVASDGLPGVVLIDINDASDAAYYHVSSPGVYVLAVDETSSAYLAGIRSGDRIVSANGEPVNASGDLPSDGYLGGLTLLLSREESELTVTLDTGSQI